MLLLQNNINHDDCQYTSLYSLQECNQKKLVFYYQRRLKMKDVNSEVTELTSFSKFLIERDFES